MTENTDPLPLMPETSPAAGDGELLAQPHYIPENDSRYRAYLAAYPHYSARMVVSLVNVNSDYGYYEQVSGITDPAGLTVLSNKNHQLPEEYVPDGLRGVLGTTFQMQTEAADALEQMAAALKAETGLGLQMISAYRSYDYQGKLYSYYAGRDGVSNADKYSARAGFSEHQTGLAADFAQKKSTSGLRALHFEETEQYAWLLENAHTYGYILRYPEGYETITGYIYEPWHWRYIGTQHATSMYEGGFNVLEEYIGYEAK